MRLSDVRNLSKDELLGMMGLEPKREVADWLVPSLGLFAVGVAVGAALGMMFAPKPGRELRGDLAHRLSSAREKMATRVEEVNPTM